MLSPPSNPQFQANTPANEATARAATTMQRVKTMVTGLESRFQEIASIADVINHVAKHTKLLSFNATIEAARW